jgi:hypothetical protein
MMEFPKAGDMITVNFDVEVEDEDGAILRYGAEQEIKVLGYDALEQGQTPEQYFEEYGSIELHVELGDVSVQNMWDRSGQSDYETAGGETYLSLDEDSGLKIVGNEN